MPSVVTGLFDVITAADPSATKAIGLPDVPSAKVTRNVAGITNLSFDATVTTVRFGRPSPADLDAYVGSGEPTAVAGGFTLDGLGGWFVDGVDGDPSSVIGIGLPLLRRLLDSGGLSVADLWSANPLA